MSISSERAPSTIAKSLDDPDETRSAADKGRIELVRLGDVTIEPCVTIDFSGGGTFAPGATR
jgi:hypothetical protein